MNKFFLFILTAIILMVSCGTDPGTQSSSSLNAEATAEGFSLLDDFAFEFIPPEGLTFNDKKVVTELPQPEILNTVGHPTSIPRNAKKITIQGEFEVFRGMLRKNVKTQTSIDVWVKIPPRSMDADELVAQIVHSIDNVNAIYERVYTDFTEAQKVRFVVDEISAADVIGAEIARGTRVSSVIGDIKNAWKKAEKQGLSREDWLREKLGLPERTRGRNIDDLDVDPEELTNYVETRNKQLGQGPHTLKIDEYPAPATRRGASAVASTPSPRGVGDAATEAAGGGMVKALMGATGVAAAAGVAYVVGSEIISRHQQELEEARQAVEQAKKPD